ncbi:hypothetical protein COO55_32375 [Rhodococcus opacus]|uniref:Uncharacterized protein n=1 Tax=Rhodococcus opacus M213 TaxID=1129896 RepID=K8XL91_RHOOP|nr:hypothetical protein [Rhodococcus opacus]EKT82179.1 hypothetical protein WSS_A13142 [Rhodococcus opacus M213]RKM76272.1 hypothetical protein COO55_32375 [Rhodococcus opacus]UNN01096.1 hypothetical protein MOO23_00620 [Rhodococcus opacus]
MSWAYVEADPCIRSPRTLRYYDEIGLLRPADVGADIAEHQGVSVQTVTTRIRARSQLVKLLAPVS